MNTAAMRIASLREVMNARSIDYFLMTSSDYHMSEYVGDFFKVTEFFSGCTSDNVVLIVGRDEARLWTDGRYFISAAGELAGSGIDLMKMGEPGVPTVRGYLKEHLAAGNVLAFDGRCISAVDGAAFRRLAEAAGASVVTDLDPADGIWNDRPALPSDPVFLISDELAGASFAEKLEAVRMSIACSGGKSLMLSRLDDICWLLNLRGNDVVCNPVVLSYLLIGPERVDLFMQECERTDEFLAYAEKNNITLHPYGDIARFLAEEEIVFPVLAEASGTSALVQELLEKRGTVIDAISPTEVMKAIKNPVEIENSRRVYLQDSAALCRFLCWFKKTIGKEPITEISAAEHLDALRAQLPGYIELSFPTISAYGPNAAMAHYSASEESNATVEEKGFLLVDSGGTYMGGTTDVTRTMAAGPLTPEQKRDFTLVAVSNLALLNARFLHGCTGRNLDTYARMPLWDLGINYNHGTGHGIGYILNVHEGPQNIRWKFGPGQKEAVFEPGMIVSDEPGIYIENGYGIRTETILLTVEDMTNEYGRWLRFEPLTWAPIDLDAIDTAWMQPRDIERLNAYHAQVREKIAPFLEGEELAWLEEATRAI